MVKAKEGKLLTKGDDIRKRWRKIGAREEEDVESFVYLGPQVNKQGGAGSEIKARIGKATAAFNKLKSVWRSSLPSRKTEIKIFKTNVVAVLLYGCETWRMTKED